MYKLLLSTTVFLFLFGCVTPNRITKTYTIDSSGKQVKIVNKYYSNSLIPSINVITSPFWHNNMIYPFYSPRVIVPFRLTPYNLPRGRRR